MGIRLSTRQIARLQAATAVLLSPFSYESGDEWRVAVCTAIAPVVDSSRAVFGLSLTDERLLAGHPHDVAPLEPHMPPTGWLRDGFVRSLRVERLEVLDWREAYDAPAIQKTDFYSEVVRPAQLFAPVIIAADVRGTPLGAAVFSYFDNQKKADERSYERKEILRLLVPAFNAGLSAYVAMRRQRETLIAFGEISRVALALFTSRGSAVHESPAFEQLVASDTEGARLRTEAKRLATNLSTSIARQNPLDHMDRPIRSRVTTSTGSYALSALSFSDSFGDAATVGVLVEDQSTPRFDAQRLVSEYHLTRRELQTAALLQRRMPAKEIAATLGVSVNTARRHTERVLAKLGVHSRHAAAERLSGVGRRSPAAQG